MGNGRFGGGAAGPSPLRTLNGDTPGDVGDGDGDGDPAITLRTEVRLRRLRTRAARGRALVLTRIDLIDCAGKYDDERGGWCRVEHTLLLRDDVPSEGV